MTAKDVLQLCIELLKAVAWPLVTLTGLLVFRTELKALIRRIKGGKFFGQEVSLGDDLDRLEHDTTAAETAVPLLGPNASAPRPEAQAETRDEVLVALTSSMPVVALVQLSSRIEQQLRELLLSAGRLAETRTLSLTPMIAMLYRSKAIPEELAHSLEQFTQIRNKIVHGQGVPQTDVERTVASGLRLLEVLTKLPRGTHTVREAGLPLFEDAEGKRPREGVQGVRIETTLGLEPTPGSVRVLPTRRRFQVGQAVSWACAADERYGETWIRDAQTGAPERAWKEAALFTGQVLEPAREAAA